MLYPTPVLAADDVRVLAEIDGMRRELRHAVRDTPAKWTSGLRKFLTADAIAASNSIEGFQVSTVDVADLIEGEHDVDVSEENLAETVAYQHMMTYIQTLHDAPDFAYSKGQLNALHWMLQGHRHSRRKPAGQWRNGPVYVTDARDPSIAAYTAPDAEEVPALMTELADWLNAPDDTHSAGPGGDGPPAPGVHPPVGRRQRADVPVAADADDRAGGFPGARVLFHRGVARTAGQHLGVLPRARQPRRYLPARAGRLELGSVQSGRVPPAGPGRAEPDRPGRPGLGAAGGLRRATGGWTSASSPPCTMWR